MGYAKLIDKNLALAFKKLQDLAITVTLTKKGDSSFDFGTGTASNDSTKTVTTKLVVTDKSRLSRDRSTIKQTVMLSTKDIGELNWYDSVTINKEEWKLGTPLRQTQFITFLEIYKES